MDINISFFLNDTALIYLATFVLCLGYWMYDSMRSKPSVVNGLTARGRGASSPRGESGRSNNSSGFPSPQFGGGGKYGAVLSSDSHDD